MVKAKMRIFVDVAKKERTCKCSKKIPKGTYHIVASGYQDSANLCNGCLEYMMKEIKEKNME